MNTARRLDDTLYDARWFWLWAREKGISTRLTNIIKRGMYVRNVDLDDICTMNIAEFSDWRGMGTGMLREFTGVFEDLKHDWKEGGGRHEYSIN